jgi:3-phenylpropionate/trans-cinnamate dioxygenase ferredoxin component
MGRAGLVAATTVKAVEVANEVEVGLAVELVAGVIRGAGRYAVGSANGELFVVARRCRHLGAELARSSIDCRGCLVRPWHGARDDVVAGRMICGPQGLVAKIPGVDAGYRLLTTVWPLGRGDVVQREGAVFVRRRDRWFGPPDAADRRFGASAGGRRPVVG